MNRSQRLALYFAELKQAPAAHDRASAHALLAKILNGIEDAHSGVPYDPANWMTDGRIYPPQEDQRHESPIAGAALYHTLGHRVWIGDNGSIRIEVRKGPNRERIELDKPGADGLRCPQ